MLEGKFRNCLCPYVDGQSVSTPCELIKQYKDDRGWIYFVRAGIGGDVFKTFYRKPGSRKEHGFGNTPWRHSFNEAQRDLGELSSRKKWMVVSEEGERSDPF